MYKKFTYIYPYMQEFHFKNLTLRRQKLKVHKDTGIRMFTIQLFIRVKIGNN